MSFSLTCSGAWTTTLPAESKPGPPRPPGHLVELPGRSGAGSSSPSYFDRAGEKYRPDRYVYPDAERVGAADDLQEPLLAEPLDQPSVLRAASRRGGHRSRGAGSRDSVCPNPLAEAETAKWRMAMASRSARGGHLRARKGLRSFDSRFLGEMYGVNWRQALRDELAYRVVDQCPGVAVVKRDRAFERSDDGRRPTRAPLRSPDKARDVAERRRHEDELSPSQFDQWHLPRPAAVGVGVEMELVHHHLVDRARLRRNAGPRLPAPRRCSR